MTTRESVPSDRRRSRTGPGWALWFFGLLAAVLVAQVVGFRPNDVKTGERRDDLDIRPGRVFDTDMYASIDARIASDLAVRGLGLLALWSVDYELFGDSGTSLVVVGDDDWLFYRNYLDVPCDAVEAVVDALEAVPLEPGVLVSVTETKGAFHADVLPDHEHQAACLAEAYERAVAAADGAFLDLSPLMRGLVADGVEAFLRQDTHWSLEARRVVAEAIVDGYAPGLWDESALIPVPGDRLVGLARFLGREKGGVTTIDGVDRSYEVVDETFAEQFAEPLLVVWRTRSDEPDVVPGTTVIIGDSQMSYVVPLLAGYFEELVFRNWLITGLGANIFAGLDHADRVFVQANPGPAPRLTAENFRTLNALVAESSEGE